MKRLIVRERDADREKTDRETRETKRHGERQRERQKRKTDGHERQRKTERQ